MWSSEFAPQQQLGGTLCLFQPPVSFTSPALLAHRGETHSVTSGQSTAATMCSRRPACCLNDPRGPDDADDDDLCPQCRSPGSCDEFKDYHRLAHIISIYREYEQTAEGDFFSHVSQVEPQRRSGHSEKWLQMTCVLFFLLAFTFLMGSIGKEDNEVQDYDADVFLPSKALWLLGCLLFWTLWLLLRLLQMLLWFIKGLLWFISVSTSPLCLCLSFLLSCALLLLHYMCNAVFFATTSPVYVYGMLLSISLLILTR